MHWTCRNEFLPFLYVKNIGGLV